MASVLLCFQIISSTYKSFVKDFFVKVVNVDKGIITMNNIAAGEKNCWTMHLQRDLSRYGMFVSKVQ